MGRRRKRGGRKHPHSGSERGDDEKSTMQEDSEPCSKVQAEMTPRATNTHSMEACGGQPLQQKKTTVFVRGQHKPLPYHIRSSHLRELFKDFDDEITNVVVHHNPKPTSFGLVTFKSESAAARAIKQLDGRALLGKFQVRLDFHQKRKNRHKDESKATQSVLAQSGSSCSSPASSYDRDPQSRGAAVQQHSMQPIGSSCSSSASSYNRDPQSRGAAVQQHSMQPIRETSVPLLTTGQDLGSKFDTTFLLTSTAKKPCAYALSSESCVPLPGGKIERDLHEVHCSEHQEHVVQVKALGRQLRENPGVLDLALPTELIKSSSSYCQPQSKHHNEVGANIGVMTPMSGSERLCLSFTEQTAASPGTNAQKSLPDSPQVNQVLPHNAHQQTTVECLSQAAGVRLDIPDTKEEIIHCLHEHKSQHVPASGESVDSKSRQVCKHELMSFDLYMFIKARCPAAVQDFVTQGGAFEHENGKAIVSAPRQTAVDSFIHSTVSSFNEFLLKLDSRQWNKFMSVGDQGKTLLTEISVPFAGNPDLKIFPLHDRLAVLLVGRESVVFQAQQHFSATLDKEITIEGLKMKALIHLHPSLPENVMKDTGAQLEGFRQGSTILSLSGQSQCVSRAKKYIEVLVGKFQCKTVTFPYVSALVESARKMLRMLRVKAYLSVPAIHRSTSVVNELEVYAFSLITLNEAVKLVRAAPLEDYVHMPPGADRSKDVATHCSHLEEAFAVSIQLPPAQTPQNRIRICGYVVNDIKEVIKALEGIVKNTPVAIPLKCNEIQSSYLRHMLSSPTAESRALIGSLPAQVSCLDNVITLTGTCGAVDTAQVLLLQSSLLQRLFGHTYTFRHGVSFLPQIEMHVLSPMKTQMRLEVTYCHEKMDSCFFTISIFSNKAADFKVASQLMKAINPASQFFETPPEAHHLLIRKSLNTFEKKHRTRCKVQSRQHRQGLMIYGLCTRDVKECWETAENHIHSQLEVTRRVPIGVLEARYVLRKHGEEIRELRKTCEVTFPQLPELESRPKQQNITVSIHGNMKQVTQAVNKIKGWCSKCSTETAAVMCQLKFLAAWEKRWKAFITTQECKHDLIVEFHCKKCTLPGQSEHRSIAVTFFVCGPNQATSSALCTNIQLNECGRIACKELSLKENQATVFQQVKQQKLSLQDEYGVVIDIDKTAAKVTLHTPLPMKDDLPLVEKRILGLVHDHTQVSRELACEVTIVGLVLTSKSFDYLRELEKLAEEHHILLQPVKSPRPCLRLKGHIGGIKAIENSLQEAERVILETIKDDRLTVPSSYLPVFSSSNFTSVKSTLQEDLCVICFHAQPSKVVQEVVYKPTSTTSVTIQICLGNITQEHTDAIVNEANVDLRHTAGLAKDISDAGGPSIQTESTKHVTTHGKLKPGDAVCLGSGNLPCRKVIHAVVPYWKGGNSDEERDLVLAVFESLVRADKANLSSIAIPALGNGMFRIPIHFCARCVLQVVRHYYCKHFPQSGVHIVRCVLPDSESVSAFVSIINSGLFQSTPSSKEDRPVRPVASAAYVKYQWSWRNDQGGYSPYEQPVSDALTATYAQPPYGGHTFLAKNKQTFRVDFATMTQTNLQSQRQRKVKHSPTAITPASEQERVQWSFRNDTGTFVPYADAQSEDIERMYRCELEGKPCLITTLCIAQRQYRFDFKEMHQINCGTLYKRLIERSVVPGTDSRTKEKDPTARGGNRVMGEAKCSATDLSIKLKGPRQYLPKARVKLWDCLRSTLTQRTIELPPNSTRELQQMLQLVARRHNVTCKYDTSKQSADQTITIEGIEQAVKSAEADILKAIIDFHGSQVEPPPPEWEKQTGTTDLFRVQRGTEEWNKVSRRFSETMPDFTIVRIVRIQNKWLWDKYVQHKQRMHEKNAGRVNEKELFHGTRETEPLKIYDSEEGFDMRFSSEGMWGQANYFAVNAKYSDRYAYQKSNGEKEIFLAKVLTGDSCRSPSDQTLRMPPEKAAGSGSKVKLGQVRYDTICGTTKGSDVYMTYSNDKAYPAYLIRYLPPLNPYRYLQQ